MRECPVAEKFPVRFTCKPNNNLLLLPVATGIALPLIYTLPAYAGVWSYNVRINQASTIGPSQKKTALL